MIRYYISPYHGSSYERAWCRERHGRLVVLIWNLNHQCTFSHEFVPLIAGLEQVKSAEQRARSRHLRISTEPTRRHSIHVIISHDWRSVARARGRRSVDHSFDMTSFSVGRACEIISAPGVGATTLIRSNQAKATQLILV